MSRLLGLREFTRIGADPRMLLLDARERPAPSLPTLDNAFFSARKLPAHADPLRLAQAVCGRHVVVVADDDERALDLCHLLGQLEVTSWALEGGADAWGEAVLAERCDAYADDELVVMLSRPASGERFYLAARGRYGIAVNPSGSVSALLEIARHHGCALEAVVDVHADDRGADVSRAAHARYIRPPIAEPVELGDLGIVRGDGGTLRLEGAAFTIGAGAGDTYRVGVSDRRPSRA